jgi:putative two-component system response regulator
MRVLIVDDSPVALLALQSALTGAGYEVSTAFNGREALKVLQREPCRLVISDWEMPEMDGLQLCREIRMDDQPGYIYFILLTSHDTPNETVEGLSAGADDFMSKPYNVAELLARVGTAERVLSLETRDVAIFAMAKVAESRDRETGAHLERVRSYSRVLTQYLAGTDKFRGRITAEYIRLIYQTSPLHDIGKVAIPDAVLLKPGKLTTEEFEVMKTHTTVGAQTLDAAVQQFPGVRFLEMARDIALTHHEWFDGSGYPGGLAAEHIPLCGRIVALADVYDALISKRVYKPEFDHDRTKSIIFKEAGTHFDPDITAAFAATDAQFQAIHERFAEEGIECDPSTAKPQPAASETLEPAGVA